jgi:prevent-host-death family protein
MSSPDHVDKRISGNYNDHIGTWLLKSQRGRAMHVAYVGIRDTKIHLSKYLKMVQKGAELIITDRGRPVGKIVPIPTEDLSIAQRLRRLEELGLVEAVSENRREKIPPPIPVPEEVAQKYLQEDRGHD